MLDILVKVFEKIVNNFYKKGVSVTLSDTPDTAYCVEDDIVLPRHLLEQFTAQKLPRFTVLYHELGHALYSNNLTKLIEKWSNLPSSHISFQYDDKYHHLLNWIEDYYIENKLLENYPFLSDVLGCLKRLTLPYDITELDKAFNHYYVKNSVTPALSPIDAVHFKQTILKLLTLRNNDNFGHGPISLLSSKSRESQFIKTLIEFYNWCVSKNILQDVYTPPLTNPNMVTVDPNGTPGQATSESTEGEMDSQDISGSYSEHSHIVGYKDWETLPTFNTTEVKIFSDQFVAEQKLIKEEIFQQHHIESTNKSLDGLFNCLFEPSPIIQSRVIVPNFFNPNRLIDQVLFKTPTKSFNNVSIYRDISGSTHGHTFTLINNICKYLDEKLPIAYNFYLYASGDISILQTDFIDWDDPYDNIPDIYVNDPVFNQMSEGTNSGAIADVISEQLNDKWLNIIVTDGDLDDLMSRDNINSLLENVFVISLIDTKDIKKLPNYVIINEEEDIEKIPIEILKMKGNMV